MPSESALEGDARGYSSANVANAAAVATIPAVAAKRGFLAKLIVTGGGATAASVVGLVVTGTEGDDLTFTIPVPAGATVGLTPFEVVFEPPIPSEDVNTAIVATLAALGAGSTRASVVAVGFVR